MTDLISRQDAIALLRGILLPDSIGHDAETLAQNYGVEQAIEALTNMPSDVIREGDKIYIKGCEREPLITLKVDKLA